MRKVKKISAFLLMLMLCINVVSLPVLAASTISQDGLEVSLITDKEEYSAGEQIELTLKVKNTNEEAVTDLSLENFVSDGYELAEGYADKLKQQIATLEAGQEVTVSVKVEQKDANVGESDNTNNAGNNQNNNNNNNNNNSNNSNNNTSNNNDNNVTTTSSPKTGDDNNIALWAVVCIVALLGTGALQLVKNKKGKDVLSIMLCVALASSGFVGASATASAAEPVKKVITAEKTVKYNGEDVTFKAEVSYLFTSDDQNDDNQNNGDQNDNNQNDDNQNNGDQNDDNQNNGDQNDDNQTGDDETGDDETEDADVLVTKITLAETAVSGKAGETYQLEPVVTPEDATNKTLSYNSSDETVATVDENGKVSFLKAGTVTITVAATDGSKVKAECTFTVTDDYKLVWEDLFDGTELNRDDWNVELHDPGWVNAEWQEYVDSDENIYLEDGKLVIKPIKTVDENGEAHYTSGRINTQDKQTFTYGKFEARVKVPEGMGYLPAFWLMANDENLYGQWPRCGEIDIMEVMGQTPNTVHGTIHYGNPHSQSQGTYVLEEGSFADDFHTFTVEWEPGKISWYVDGILYHTESEWYSVTEGQGEITYPAPFDQPFYVILNLAVGGSWVGYPDDTTDFENATYEVDYVKVYQKDSYDENVTKPEVEVVLRDPDANGNYIVNGDFAVAEDLSDEKDWSFLLANGGEATAKISNNEMVIDSTNAGTVDYSVQLVQPNLPMQKGATYKLTFDAYADEARTMIVDISSPDRNYVRYLADTKVNLTTEKQTFTYEFTMTSDDDANGRLEFNLGNQGSVAGVKISNVKLEKTAFEEIKEDDTKTVLTDGNHVYNGSFQEGENRLGYWDITNKAGAEVSVTNIDDERSLKIVAPEGTSAEKPVIISQSGLALSDGSNYAFTFDVEGQEGTIINVTVAGASWTIELHDIPMICSDKFTAADGSAKDLVFTITEPGTYYLDNIRIVEDSLIKNGNFSAGFAGFEPFVDSSISSEVTYVVDSLNEDNAADFTINNTGTQDWLIQLKQEDVELENGQWYRLTLDAKSSIARKLMVAIQRNGNIHTDDWTPYCQETVDLGTDYQNYVFEFQMTEETDAQSVLSISMGAVGGTQITEQHRVVIDNINLEKIDAPEQEEIVAGANLILNPTFANEAENWEGAITSPGTGTVTYSDGSATFDITNVGTEDWHAQLKTFGIKLENGQSYKVSFKASSTADRSMAVNVMSKSYDWYGGTSANLTSEAQPFEFTFNMTTDNLDAGLFFSMGKIADVDTPASTITISDVSVVKLDGSSDDGASDDEDTESDEETEDGSSTGVEGAELIQNGDFANGEESWVAGINSPAVASVDYSNNKATFTIDNVGTENWHLQLMQNDLALESGETYKVTLKIKSSADRDIKWALLDPSNSYHWYGGEAIALTADTEKEVSYDVTADATSSTVQFQITMAPDSDSTNMPEGTHTIEISDVSVVKTSGSADTETGDGESSTVVEGTELIQNGDFANGEESWVAGINSPAVASVDYSNNKATFTIDNVGTENWHLQFMQNNLALESGETYKVTLKIKSSADRDIKWALLDPSNSYKWYGGEAIALTADTEKEVSYDVTADATSSTVQFQITMAPDSDSTNMPEGTHTIEISDVSVVKTSTGTDAAASVNTTTTDVANVTASVSDGDAQ